MAERTSQYFQILLCLFLVGSLPYKQMLLCIKGPLRKVMFCTRGTKCCAAVELNRQFKGQGRKSNDNMRNHESLGRETGSSTSESVQECFDIKLELSWSFFTKDILKTFKKNRRLVWRISAEQHGSNVFNLTHAGGPKKNKLWNYFIVVQDDRGSLTSYWTGEQIQDRRVVWSQNGYSNIVSHVMQQPCLWFRYR